MNSDSKPNNTFTYNGEIVAGSLLINESRKISRLLLNNADSEAWHQAKRERMGRNPATGDDMMLALRGIVTFRSSGKLREKVNGK